MAQKPSLPKGTRDFGPQQMLRRNYILDNIRSVFKNYGFMPLETPAMENLSTLTGKYGDEGDQLLFKVLNSGDYLSKASEEDIKGGSKILSKKITEKGLKYDLTVPFARYVVSNQNDITFPFKRYQIQPVWRADRPQKGRYREFYQCDVDVIGTKSLICEAELMCIVHEVFESLQFNDYLVSISSRKILEGIAEVLGINDQFAKFVVILDKLDKIGEDRVIEELKNLDVEQSALEKLKTLLNLEGSNDKKLQELKSHFTNSSVGLEGIKDLEEVLQHCQDLGRGDNNLVFDISLARGLSYYTGVIYEVKPTSISMGSITAGGRYDNLTGNFGLPGVSGVGISFGVDRIYDTLNELGLFPTDNLDTTSVLITNFDEEAQKAGLNILSSLRSNGIKSEIYPDQAKLKKQMNYADKKSIPYVILVGSQEIESGNYSLKNMKNGLQQQLSLDEIISLLK
jgi:histidyl-tRNA synthetase